MGNFEDTIIISRGARRSEELRFPRWFGLAAIAFGLLVAGVVFWRRSQTRVVSEAEMQRRTQPVDVMSELPLVAPVKVTAPAKLEKHAPPPARTSRR